MVDYSLEIIEGPGAGRLVALRGMVEIGRDPTATVVVEDQLVSRHHVRVTPDVEGAVVEDLGSLNGTFVNGNQVHSPIRMTQGDQLLLGVTVLQLRSAKQIAEQPSAVQQVPPALSIPERRPDFIPQELL